jgi:hypothetical protein
MVRHRAYLLAGALLLGSCASNDDRVPPAQQRWVAAGEPVTCININQLRRTSVIDDQTIDFIMSGRDRVFRNNLPVRCSGLGFNRGFTHNARAGQLCSMNTITVLEPGRGTGAVCPLGRFQPMVRVPAPATP